MTRSVRKVWTFQSDSDPTVQYETLQDPNPIIVRKLKNLLLEGKTRQKTLIIIGCRLVLPPELEREITVVEFALPGKEALQDVLGGVVESAGLAALSPEQQEQAIDAACGLTTIEAENAFALSYVQTRSIEPSVVYREKAQAVKKSGLLEIIEDRESLDSIGGLNVLKDWLLKRRNAFPQRAADYGLPPAKGLLIIGIAGTGKSLSAKVAARVFDVPLLKLDAGRLYPDHSRSAHRLCAAIQDHGRPDYRIEDLGQRTGAVGHVAADGAQAQETGGVKQRMIFADRFQVYHPERHLLTTAKSTITTIAANAKATEGMSVDVFLACGDERARESR
jgi:hypothetical protein